MTAERVRVASDGERRTAARVLWRLAGLVPPPRLAANTPPLPAGARTMSDATQDTVAAPRDGGPTGTPGPSSTAGSDTRAPVPGHAGAVHYPPLAVTRPELHDAIVRFLAGDDGALPDTDGLHPVRPLAADAAPPGPGEPGVRRTS